MPVKRHYLETDLLTMLAKFFARASIWRTHRWRVKMISRNIRSLAKLIPAIGLIAAAASPLAVVEYKIPRERAFPHDPAVGADGIVWYTDQQNSFIGRLDPATGKITDYPTPTAGSGPHGIVVAPDGGVWYTAQRIAKLCLLYTSPSPRD